MALFAKLKKLTITSNSPKPGSSSSSSTTATTTSPSQAPPSKSRFKSKASKELNIAPEILFQIIRAFLSIADPKDLRNFLVAFPKLSPLFIIITDEQEPLCKVSSVATLSFGEFHRSTSLWMHSIPFRIFSFKAADEVYGVLLTHDPGCFYGRYLTADSHVLYSAVQPLGLCAKAVREISARANVLKCTHVPSKEEANSVYIDSYKTPNLSKVLDLTIKPGSTIDYSSSHPNNPKLTKRKDHMWLFPKTRKIMYFDSVAEQDMGGFILLPHGEMLRVDITNEACHSDSRYECVPSSIYPMMQNATQVVIRFASPMVPRVYNHDFKCRRSDRGKESGTFTFAVINANWSLENPWGKACPHAVERGMCQAEHSHWYFFFESITTWSTHIFYEGIPDDGVKFTDFREVETFTRKRLATRTRDITTGEILNLKKARNLTVYDAVTRTHLEVMPIPFRFTTGDLLNKLVLVNLPHSSATFKYDFHFAALLYRSNDEPLDVHLVSLEHDVPIPFTNSEMGIISKWPITSLSLIGYNIEVDFTQSSSFVRRLGSWLPEPGPEVCGFTELETLTLDISNTRASYSRKIYLQKKIFPVLKRLVIKCPQKAPILSDPEFDSMALELDGMTADVVLPAFLLNRASIGGVKLVDMPDVVRYRDGSYYLFAHTPQGYKYKHPVVLARQEYDAHL